MMGRGVQATVFEENEPDEILGEIREQRGGSEV